MFIEINNYETGQTEPINLYDVAYFYKKDNDDPSNPYVIVYKMVSGITYLEGFASSGDADDKVAELSDSVAGGGLAQFDTFGDFPDEGNKSMVYIAKDTGQTYYWDESTSTYITTGTSGRTGVYQASVDLSSTIGATTTVNKSDLTVLVTPTVAYSEGSEVVGANATHGLIVSSTSSAVTVKTIMDATIDSFKQVASESSLPQIGQENVLYYLQDTDTFRTWDPTAQDYVEPDYMKELYLVSYGDTTITYNDVMTAITKNRNVFCNVRVGQGYRMVPLCFYDRTKIEFRFIRNVNHGAYKTSDELHTYQLLPDNSWNTVVTNICTKIVAGTNMTSSYDSSTDALTLNGPSNYLATDNTTEFTPTADYQPATKKYVDDNAGSQEITYLFSSSSSTDRGTGSNNRFDLNSLSKGKTFIKNYSSTRTFYVSDSYTFNDSIRTDRKDLQITPKLSVGDTKVIEIYLDMTIAEMEEFVKTSDTNTSSITVGYIRFWEMYPSYVPNYVYSIQLNSSTNLPPLIYINQEPATLNFTKNFYVSQSASSGGTTLSLVSTGEKYTWNNKQDALVSGTNIKTINNESILGSGNIDISGGVIPYFDSTDLSGSTDIGNTSAKPLDFSELKMGLNIVQVNQPKSSFYYKFNWDDTEKTGSTTGIKDLFTNDYMYWKLAIITMYVDPSDFSVYTNDHQPLGDVKFISYQNNCTQYFIDTIQSVKIIRLNYPQTYVLANEANTALNNKENTSNKVTSLSSSSTDTQYPSAKAVYDAIYGVLNDDY